jgi:hypothetical protein
MPVFSKLAQEVSHHSESTPPPLHRTESRPEAPARSRMPRSCPLAVHLTTVVPGGPLNYTSARLLHEPLHRLRLVRAVVLDLPWGAFRGPLKFQDGDRLRPYYGRRCRHMFSNRSYVPRAYNPSVVAAPAGLCARCAFVVAVRVDAQHQCNAGGALMRGFVGTALIVLDSQLRRLAWTWYLNNRDLQLRSTSAAHTVGLIWEGRTDGSRAPLPLPWPQGLHDVRLLPAPSARLQDSTARPSRTSTSPRVAAHHLLATHQCRKCRSFVVFIMHLVATPSADGGLLTLNAWSNPPNDLLSWNPANHPSYESLLGSNQALWLQPSANPGGRDETVLVAQPWLGTILELGVVGIERGSIERVAVSIETHHALYAPQAKASHHSLYNHSSATTYLEGPGSLYLKRQLGPVFMAVDKDAVQRLSHWLDTTRAQTPGPALPPPPPPPSRPSASFKTNEHGGDSPSHSPPILSTSAHLIRIRRYVRGRACDALLGIGHRHLGRSTDGKAWRFAAQGWASRPQHTFRWGHRYAHHFYTLQPRRPHKMLGASAEFCLHASVGQDAGSTLSATDTAKDSTAELRCESVQIVFGLAQAGEDVVVSFGANDCEAKLGWVRLEQIWEMLRPLELNATTSFASCDLVDEFK